MKKIFKLPAVVFIFLLIITTQSNSQTCLKWKTNVGGNNNDGESTGNVIAVSNGFLTCGTANSNNPAFGVPSFHGNDAYIAKLDGNGNVVWRHTYGGSGDEVFKMIIQTSDGGFIAAGHTSSNDGDVNGNHGGDRDAWIVKINATGVLQWQKCYGGNGDDYFLSITAETSGYIISGATSSRDGDITSNNGDYDAWIVKLSSTGTIVWQSTYGGTRFDEADGITRNTDGSYIFAGATTTNNQQVGNIQGGTYDTRVVKISNTGSIIWKKLYGGKGYDYCNGLTRTSDGNIVLGHGSNSTDGDVNGTGSFAMWLLKINQQTGDIIWSKTFSGNLTNAASFGIFSTSDGGVVSLGVQAGSVADEATWDAFILAVDANGNKQWSRILAGSNEDDVDAGIQVSNGDLIILGSSLSTDGDFAGGSGNSDIWLAKFHNCNDNAVTQAVPPSDDMEVNAFKLSAFPNPFSQSTTILFSVAKSAKVSLKIFDLNGRLITTLANEEMQIGNHEIKWNVNDANGKSVSSGIYLLRIQAGNYSETRKLSVIK